MLVTKLRHWPRLQTVEIVCKRKKNNLNWTHQTRKLIPRGWRKKKLHPSVVKIQQLLNVYVELSSTHHVKSMYLISYVTHCDNLQPRFHRKSPKLTDLTLTDTQTDGWRISPAEVIERFHYVLWFIARGWQYLHCQSNWLFCNFLMVLMNLVKFRDTFYYNLTFPFIYYKFWSEKQKALAVFPIKIDQSN